MADGIKSNRIRRLKHIEAFSAVISTGSFSAAARQLGVSQPAISQLIKVLEDAIGAPLFIRRNGAVFPTSRAESLREDAVSLLAHLDRFQAQLSYGRTGVLSTVRLTASMSIASELLPSIVSEIVADHPDAMFYVSSVPLSSMVQSLIQGHVDFAFHTRPLEHPGLHNEKVGVAPLVAVMRADNPLAAAKSLSVRDFAGQRIISSTRNDPAFHYFSKLWHENGVSIKTVLQSPFAGFAIRMVEALSAVTFNNALVAEKICDRDPNLIMRQVAGLDFETSFFLACADWQNGSDTQKKLITAFETLAVNMSTE
ncbi:LysR family transcriptional regulator [Shimia sp. R9_1]|uniref:LysR family transcriptional regulator n=1 Tax=Shimia sp. R9_1 TaxID=2821111 RepID=UPI001ADAFA51|nr:LysR family transcriptional regulator [Shimia sp. R9_1]MBO9409737.1 LysR family transcriptional regulator [Shimia sp. R9_1]